MQDITTKIYELVEQGEISKAVMLIYSFVEDCYVNERLDEVDNLLAVADVIKMEVQTMTALLRITSRGKLAHKNWIPFRKKVVYKLHTDNYPNKEGVLIGLWLNREEMLKDFGDLKIDLPKIK